jgi:hypothetical protein
LPEKSLTERIETFVKIVGEEKGATGNQINSILKLIKTVRDDGCIDDDALNSFFELVGDDSG